MIARLLRLWFTFDDPIPRRTYLVHGAALMALKFAVDALLYGIGTGRVWLPTFYFHTLTTTIATGTFAGAPSWLLPVMGAWSLPFLWIGVTLTLRRALDAGLSAWLSLLFFVPVVNWITIAALAIVPTRSAPNPPWVEKRPYDKKLPSAMMAVAAGLITGLVGFMTAVIGRGEYSAPLFFGTPVFIGAITAFVYNRRYAASSGETTGLVMLATCLVGALFISAGFEGMVCVIMASPLALLAAFIGSKAGQEIARDMRGSPARGMMTMLALPAAILAEPPARPALREVVSSVEIDAAPAIVWHNVIAFPEIPEPTEFVFRAGIAWPRHARIVGTGIGAVRYCVFSTGAFVEPITRWEPGHQLSFDVTSSPPPLRELSPYANIAPPHLDSWLRSRRGEFRLVELPGGRTRLEGSTWYEQRLAPEAYWVVYSDWLIHRIHLRVLDHIKAESERAARR